jgi:hypothetical protein
VSLACAIDDAHPATADFFKNLVVAKSPMGIGDRDRGESGLEVVRLILVDLSGTTAEEAPQAKPLSNPRTAMTAGTFLRRWINPGE